MQIAVFAFKSCVYRIILRTHNMHMLAFNNTWLRNIYSGFEIIGNFIWSLLYHGFEFALLCSSVVNNECNRSFAQTLMVSKTCVPCHQQMFRLQIHLIFMSLQQISSSTGKPANRFLQHVWRKISPFARPNMLLKQGLWSMFDLVWALYKP